MIRNYLTIALRNLQNNKMFSAINVAGLTLGIGAALLLFQYAAFELSYDRFHERADDIYRVNLDIYKNNNMEAQSARVSPAVAAAFQSDIPAIESHTRMVILGPDGVLTHNDRFTSESNIVLGDSAFFHVFSFRLLQGNKNTALTEPFCVVIGEHAASTLFGDEDPIGKIVTINAKNFDGTSMPFKVTGVMEDLPTNTHLNLAVLISYPTLYEFVGHQFDNSWSWNETYTYFHLHPKTDPEALEVQFPHIVHRHNPKLDEQNLDWQYKLQPITSIHLGSDLQHEMSVNGRATYVYALLVVAILILVIAYVNYINLVTVKAMQRAKEIGIRKVSGALRTQLIGQFIVESLVVNLVALVLAIVIADAVRLQAANVFGVTFLSLREMVLQPILCWGLLSLIFLLVAGSALYPALVLSRAKPIDALRETFSKGQAGNATRKWLVTGQFATAMILIALTLAAATQIRYMREQSLGFNADHMVIIKAPKAFDYGYGTNFTGFQNKVAALASVQDVSAANVVPGQEIYWYDEQVTLNGEGTSGIFSMLAVAPNYFSHFDIDLIAGRLFSNDESDQDKWIINESAARLLGFANAGDALGQKLNDGEIIGVVKDFHHQSLKTTIPPVMFTAGRNFNYYSVRLHIADVATALAEIQAAYGQLFPGSPYEYFFLDEFFDRQYKSDMSFNNLFGLFSTLGIVVACLGLFGLSSHLAARRTKEIGIRKVMGASIFQMAFLLTRDFMKLILTAAIIAIPLAWYFIHRWLEAYASRVDIVWWLLVAPLVITMLLAVVTVSFQTIRAALVNPVKCLRYE